MSSIAQAQEDGQRLMNGGEIIAPQSQDDLPQDEEEMADESSL
jgi:hypothetical protein